MKIHMPLLTLLAGLCCGITATAQEPRRNILFIAVDDLRPALGCAGDPIAKTPNIDALAATGTVFTKAYCQQAVCSPSRTSLLTGRRPDTTRVYDLVTHFRTALPHVVTLPQYFKEQGWYVHGIGKIYHPGSNDKASWSVPWEEARGSTYGPEGRRILAQRIAANTDDDLQVRGPAFEEADCPDESLTDGWTATRAAEILAARKNSPEPFFLAVGFARPHLPFAAPGKYWQLYDPARLPIPETDAPPKDAPAFAPQYGGELRQYAGIPKSGPLPKDQTRRLVHGYYAAVSYIDAQVGRVLKALKDNGHAENTLVVLWGDHGWHLGDHGMWCKHTNYEKATRSALVVHAPGQKSPGRSCSRFVELVDIYPTLAELCGLPPPVGVEGHSFAPLLDDPTRTWKPAAFSQYPRNSRETGPLMGYAVRSERYRYVEWRKKSSNEVVARELYDHLNDPDENTNIAADERSRRTVEGMARMLEAGWKANAPPR
jgi:arylsulfatase A-like enzyme